MDRVRKLNISKYNHFAKRLQGVVLNWLSRGTALPFTFTKEVMRLDFMYFKEWRRGITSDF
jgi:hypothetical protein